MFEAHGPFPPVEARTILSRIVQPTEAVPPIRRALGEALRALRRRRGFTLREVAALSQGRFKPSGLGGYERGERAITVERLSQLASVYGMPADRVVADALERLHPDEREEIVLDIGALEVLPGHEPQMAATMVREIADRRGQPPAGRFALRTGDLEVLAMASRVSPGELLRRLEPAVHRGSNDG